MGLQQQVAAVVEVRVHPVERAVVREHLVHVAEAGQVGREHVRDLGECGHDLAERVRREHLQTVDVGVPMADLRRGPGP
ncbi:hypothetical protein O7622_17460 [Micromonospora sp. WMMD1076]|uniref:hypothetical protein n=1 Tax=Micromonospora sp. WMMD1076 TaxID=3016103 RepID=UPI00249C704A|nr:hypothetical protein [Micromonospora sp. WMMD1076]WFF04855.1 hypothetical protein O7622_17460 [Micromonospora sp. WMMD1076]